MVLAAAAILLGSRLCDGASDGRICRNVNCAQLLVGKSGAITATILRQEKARFQLHTVGPGSLVTTR